MDERGRNGSFEELFAYKFTQLSSLWVSYFMTFGLKLKTVERSKMVKFPQKVGSHSGSGSYLEAASG